MFLSALSSIALTGFLRKVKPTYQVISITLLEEAISGSKEWVTSLHGGCAASFGSCRRFTKNETDKDFYEPFEPMLRRDNLPELFFCNPKSLDNEFLKEYKAMAMELWNKPA
jgi:hypothetical protein